MKFSQDSYKDKDGNDILAEDVKYITTYKYAADGFYTWWCGKCWTEHASRSGWRINGQVLTCEQCSEKSLLLRSDCKDVDDAITWFLSKERTSYQDLVKENEKLHNQLTELHWKLERGGEAIVRKLLRDYLDQETTK